MNRPIVVALAFACIAGSAAAQPAPSGRRAPPPRLVALDARWTLTFETAVTLPPAFDQEQAYVSMDGALVAIRLTDGTPAWRTPLDVRGTLATGDGLVFAASGQSIVALEQRTGAVAWRAEVTGELHGAVFWESGWLLASTTAGDLLALRPQDGALLWRSPLGSPLAVAPTSADEAFFVALGDGRVLSLQVDSGAVSWSAALNEPVTGVLALREQLLVGTRANLLRSLSRDGGRERWRQKAGGDVLGAPVADDEHVYFVAYDNVLRALARRSGNVRWVRRLSSRPIGGAQLAEAFVIVPFTTEVIGVYHAATGAEAFTVRTVGELAGVPFVRDAPRPTAPVLIAMSREVSATHTLQGFAPRVEAPPVPLAELPGAKVGG